MPEQYRKTIADLWAEYGALAPTDTPEGKEAADYFLTGMRTAVVLKASSMVTVAATSFQDDGELPSCVPPWPATLVEWDQTTTAESVAEMKSLGYPVAHLRAGVVRVGILFLHDKAERRVAAFGVSTNRDGTIRGPVHAVAYEYDERGSALLSSMSYLPGVGLLSAGTSFADGVVDVARRAWGVDSPLLAGALTVTVSAMLVLSLANCRNVTAVEHRPPARLSRRNVERHGQPLTRYYTLDIEPMRKVLKTEGRLDEVGLTTALHLCRGHFKDYRDSAGLFGKHKGLYWWDSNVRGSVKAGVVAKDYALRPR